jgi:lipopolysaccharide transport system ATP-binding protein
MIKTKEGIALFGSDTSHDAEILDRCFYPFESATLGFKFRNVFAPGNYYLNCGIRDDGNDDSAFLHRRVDALIFTVQPNEENFVKHGIVNTSLTYSLDVIGAES